MAIHAWSGKKCFVPFSRSALGNLESCSYGRKNRYLIKQRNWPFDSCLCLMSETASETDTDAVSTARLGCQSTSLFFFAMDPPNGAAQGNVRWNWEWTQACRDIWNCHRWRTMTTQAKNSMMLRAKKSFSAWRYVFDVRGLKYLPHQWFDIQKSSLAKESQARD